MVDAFDPKPLEEVVRALKKCPVILAREMRTALERSGQRWLSTMHKRTGSRAVAFPERNSSGTLARRTGMLQRSLRVEMAPANSTKVWMALTSRGTSYAATQELGAVIKPKRAKRLWIPLAENMTPTGRMRKTPRSLMSEPDESLAFVPNAKGNITVFWKSKTAGKGTPYGVPMFYLVRRVTIPGPKTTGTRSRFGFFDTWNNKDAAAKRREEFEYAVHSAANQALAGGA